MIADRLKLARRKAGFSLRDLSAAMGDKVTAQAIGKYERAESIPSSGVLLALTKALDVSLSYLLDTQGIALSGVEFRTKANTTARDRAQVETEVLEWVERYLQIEQILERDSAEWQCPLSRPRALQSVGRRSVISVGASARAAVTEASNNAMSKCERMAGHVR